MPQVVGGHGELIALGGAFRLLQPGLVDGRIDHQGIEAESQRIDQGLNAHPNTVEVPEIHADVVEFLARDAQGVSGGSCPDGIAVGRHHRPTPISQGFHGIESHSGGGASHQHRTGTASRVRKVG